MTNKIEGVTLGSTYAKQGAELGIKVNKTFLVPMEHIYIEPGFNVRDLDPEHVESIRQGYDAGQPIPPITVKTTPQGFKVIDGHHRYSAAELAGVTRLECKEFLGSDADVVALMITSSQGKNLSPIERGRAYQRLITMGLTTAEIADRVKRSRADVDNHLLLMSAGDTVLQAVATGAVGSSAVVKELRKSGADGLAAVEAAVQVAKEKGTKVKPADLNPFTKADYNRVMEILCGMNAAGLPPELGDLITKYRGV